MKTTVAISEDQKKIVSEAIKNNSEKITEYFLNMFTQTDLIEDQLVTALEGGINYWGGLDNEEGKCIIPEGFKKEKGEPLSIWCSRVIKAGGSIKFYDIEESEDDSTWILNLDKMIKGFIKMATDSPSHFADMVGENGDATTADVYIQYCLFDTIVFG